MFQMRIGSLTGRVDILSHLSSCGEMKLSVAPESIRTSHSAIACADWKSTDIHRDQ